MQSMAQPLRIQWSSLSVVGMGKETTKLVECPVVERVPALREVLQRTVVHALGAVGLGDRAIRHRTKTGDPLMRDEK
jgi:hypothetical protein